MCLPMSRSWLYCVCQTCAKHPAPPGKKQLFLHLKRWETLQQPAALKVRALCVQACPMQCVHAGKHHRAAENGRAAAGAQSDFQRLPPLPGHPWSLLLGTRADTRMRKFAFPAFLYCNVHVEPERGAVFGPHLTCPGHNAHIEPPCCICEPHGGALAPGLLVGLSSGTTMGSQNTVYMYGDQPNPQTLAAQDFLTGRPTDQQGQPRVHLSPA